MSSVRILMTFSGEAPGRSVNRLGPSPISKLLSSAATILLLVLAILGSDRCDSRSFQKVLVVGANGRVGSSIVSKLVAHGVDTTVMVRDIDSARANEKLKGAVIFVGNVNSMDDLIFASEGCDAIVSVQGVKPTRYSRLKDLITHPRSDPNHPYNVNYMGTKRLLAAMHVNRIDRIVRVTGALVGKSAFYPFTALFNILLSKTVKWHELSEIALRQSNVNYTIVRPSEISSTAATALYAIAPTGTDGDNNINNRRRAFLISADAGRSFKVANSIAVDDVAEICTQSLFDDRLQKATVICGTSVPDTKQANSEHPTSWNQLVEQSEISSDKKKLVRRMHNFSTFCYSALVAAVVGSFANCLMQLVRIAVRTLLIKMKPVIVV